jgi:hypothetical protein
MQHPAVCEGTNSAYCCQQYTRCEGGPTQQLLRAYLVVVLAVVLVALSIATLQVAGCVYCNHLH